MQLAVGEWGTGATGRCEEVRLEGAGHPPDLWLPQQLWTSSHVDRAKGAPWCSPVATARGLYWGLGFSCRTDWEQTEGCG